MSSIIYQYPDDPDIPIPANPVPHPLDPDIPITTDYDGWADVIPSPIPVSPDITLLNDNRFSDVGNALRELRREDIYYNPKEMPDIIRTTSFSAFYDIHGYGGLIANEIEQYEDYQLLYAIAVGPEVLSMENILRKDEHEVSDYIICAPACGPNVVTMSGAFANCYCIAGSPVCGPKVENLFETYYNCYNLTGSPACTNNVINMANAYYNCQNIVGEPKTSSNAINMSGSYYNCFNLTGSPVCGPNVIDFNEAYSKCENLTGQPVCGPKVEYMHFTYGGCYNLTGEPVCGPNVIYMTSAYSGCSNLIGAPRSGTNVLYMDETYYGCENLTGQPACGPNVILMDDCYAYCYNLNGSVVIEDNVISAKNCFYRTCNISTICINNESYSSGYGLNVKNLYGAFDRTGIPTSELSRMNVVVKNSKRYGDMIKAKSIWGVQLQKGPQSTPTTIEAPLVYPDGKPTGVKILYQVNNCWFNETYKIYVYN